MLHTVERGETETAIAHRYGVSVLELLLANDHKPWTSDGTTGAPLFDELYEGEPLYVPTHGAELAATDDDFSGAIGDDPTAKVWKEIFPNGSGDYTFQKGERYAVLVSVSKNYSLSQMVQKLNDSGTSITYSWEWGTPTRNTYAVDDWLAQIPKDQRDNHRWIYFEGNRAGPTDTLGQDSPWPTTIYHIAHVFIAAPAPAQKPNQPPQTLPPADSKGCPSIPSAWPQRLYGGAVGAGVGTLVTALVGWPWGVAAGGVALVASMIGPKADK